MAKGRRTASPSARPNQDRSVSARRTKPFRPADSRRDRTAKASGLGGEQVEGRQAVKELLRARKRKVKEIWLSDAVERSGIVLEILDLALEAKVPVATVSRAKLDGASRSEGSQGIVAFSEQLLEFPLEELAQEHRGTKPFLVVLDGITDPHNLGAILRSAECAGVTGVVLPEHRSVHVTPSASKSAAGSIEYLRLALVPGVAAALQVLSKMGVWLVGLDAQADKSIYDASLYDQPLALVFGAEGKGLSQLVRRRCDTLASIPQYGQVPSLNVSNAATLSMFEVARARSSH